LCYSNHLQRAPYDKNFTKAWCKEMSAAIKRVDSTRRVTLGDLAASLSPTGPPSCSAEDGIDYYSLHLYPHGNDTLTQMAEKWKRRIDTLPDDGLPVIIEEMYPLGGAAGVSWTDMLQAYVKSTSPRTVGWMSFYWGTAEQLNMNPIGAALYDKWLGIFSKGRPW
jgi:endo-1,4-beta-mannosidase